LRGGKYFLTRQKREKGEDKKSCNELEGSQRSNEKKNKTQCRNKSIFNLIATLKDKGVRKKKETGGGKKPKMEKPHPVPQEAGNIPE